MCLSSQSIPNRLGNFLQCTMPEHAFIHFVSVTVLNDFPFARKKVRNLVEVMQVVNLCTVRFLTFISFSVSHFIDFVNAIFVCS